MCIIINCDFGSFADGSERDVRCMEALFTACLFKCIVHTDKKAHEIEELLKDAAKSKEHKEADCLVVILMLYGEKEINKGEDKGEDKCKGDALLDLLKNVYATFNNEKCPALKGKPKLFFIEACKESTWRSQVFLSCPRISFSKQSI
ncbi:hypothetical protein MTO96_012188 [Rhipicephalus appendiculatus]